MRILAIENDLSIHETLVDMLIESPLDDAIAALTPNSALTLLQNSGDAPFDVILINDAFVARDPALISDIRITSGYSTVPIVLLTDDVPPSAEAFDDLTYLRKPLQQHLLRRHLDRLFPSDHRLIVPQVAPQPDGPIPLSAALKVIDIQGFIDFKPLVVYANQLSRNQLFKTSAMGFTIRNIALYHAALDPFDFHSMIIDVADAIATEMAQDQALFTYVGDGVFVGLVENNLRPLLQSKMRRINARIADGDLNCATGMPLDVMVSAGDPVSMTWRSGKTVTDALHAARDSAVAAAVSHGKLRDDFWYLDRIA